MADSVDTTPAKHRRVCLLLGVLGFVWLLWLFFSSPDLALWPPDSEQDRVAVECQPLGSLSRDTLDADDSLTFDQYSKVDPYVEKASEDDPRISQENLNELRDDIETAMVTHCQAARLTRLAWLGIAGLLTGILLLVAVIGTRPWPDTGTPTAE